MAEMTQAPTGGKKGGKVRSKKLSTRIDFTPMVDLGFLLITFFMLTTTLSKPQIMRVVMPSKDKPKEQVTEAPADATITVILSRNDRIYYYYGFGDEETGALKVEVTDFSDDGIRKILLEKHAPWIKLIEDERAKLNAQSIPLDTFNKRLKDKITEVNKEVLATWVIIKADEHAKFENLVDMVDELRIANITKYAIVDITQKELDLIATL
jgi:biopolymer transport protein ExbD